MPEMGWEPADLVLAPTSWRLDMLPDAQVLPVPIARDRLPYRQRDGVDTLYHIASNAFHDRNGTDLVLAALEHMRSSCRLLIRTPADVTKTERIGPVHVEWVGHHHGPYYEWPDVDLFVLPRRFAGLCLPMQEAFSLGVPVVTLDIAPQNEWPASLIPAHRIAKRVHMKGGPVDIYGCDPEHLAARIDHLISNPDEVADLSARGDAWAETLAWEHWTDTYRASL
jgi:glycosyltransferase involved in cell wall biosynthesis